MSDSKGNIFNTLKNLIFEEEHKEKPLDVTITELNEPFQEPLKKQKTKDFQPSEQTNISEPQITQPPELVKTDAPSGEVVQQFCRQLRDIINVVGPEYIQFQNMLNSLNAVIPDEKTLYRSTEIALLKMGISSEKVLNAVDTRISNLLKEEKTFEQNVLNQTTVIDEKEKKFANIDNQIEVFKKEIEKLESSKGTIRNEINTMKNQIDTDRADFGKALKSVVQELEKDKQRIQQYLGKGV